MGGKKVEEYDVVIIGGGAAGMTAAIYAGRARLNTLIIEQALVGGLATNTNEIQNYPGFPEGVTGKGLMELFYQQAKKFNVKFKFTDVRKVHLKGEIKKVETFRNIYEAKAVIIASGGRPRMTGADKEQDYLGKGIAFCATCDATAKKGKIVVVIGSGDTAIEESIFLTKFADKVVVSVIHDKEKMDCNELTKEAALKNSKIEFKWNTEVDHFKGGEQLKAVVLKNLKTGELITIDCHTCFEFIGYIPNTDLFKGVINITEKGYIVTNEKMETNIEGVYAIGDVREKYLRQVATCVGDGATAGVEVEKYIAESEAFKSLITKKDRPGIAYVFNAIEPEQRNLLVEIEKMEETYKKQFYFNKIDIYKSKGLANRLGIKKIPAVAIIKYGKVSCIITEDISRGSILKALE